MKSTPTLLYCLVVLLHLSGGCAKFSLYNSTALIFETSTGWIPFEGSTKYFNAINATVTFNDMANNISNSIVLANIVPPPEQHILSYQTKGAVAVIIVTTAYIPGGSIGYRNNGDSRDLTVPVMDMIYADFENISNIILENMKTGSIVYGVLEYEPNAWLEVAESPLLILVQVSLGLLMLANIGVELYAWTVVVRKSKDRGIMMVIPHIILGLLLGANLIRLVSLIDFQGWYRLLTYQANLVLFTLPTPFVMSAALLLTFYWHECLAQSVTVNPFLDRFRIPFFLIAGVFFIFEAISNGLRIYTLISFWSTILFAYNLIIAISLAIFFLVTVVRVFSRLKAKKSIGDKKRRGTVRITSVLLAISIALILFCISLLASLILLQTPSQVLGSFFFLICTLHLVSLTISTTFIVHGRNNQAQSSNTSSVANSAGTETNQSTGNTVI